LAIRTYGPWGCIDMAILTEAQRQHLDNFFVNNGVPASIWRRAAAVESSYDTAAVGDAGKSFGLFQLHQPAHPALAGKTAEQLQDINLQANFMLYEFQSGYSKALAKGYTGTQAYNYAAWAAERPAADFNTYSGWIENKITGNDYTGSPGIPTGGTGTATSTPQDGTGAAVSTGSWKDNWMTNTVLIVVGVLILAFGLYSMVKKTSVQEG